LTHPLDLFGILSLNHSILTAFIHSIFIYQILFPFKTAGRIAFFTSRRCVSNKASRSAAEQSDATRTKTEMLKGDNTVTIKTKTAMRNNGAKKRESQVRRAYTSRLLQKNDQVK